MRWPSSSCITVVIVAIAHMGQQRAFRQKPHVILHGADCVWADSIAERRELLVCDMFLALFLIAIC